LIRRGKKSQQLHAALASPHMTSITPGGAALEATVEALIHGARSRGRMLNKGCGMDFILSTSRGSR
jgi:hypothetical protein